MSPLQLTVPVNQQEICAYIAPLLFYIPFSFLSFVLLIALEITMSAE